jgi:hypothetical protein
MEMHKRSMLSMGELACFDWFARRPAELAFSHLPEHLKRWQRLPMCSLQRCLPVLGLEVLMMSTLRCSCSPLVKLAA